MNQAEKKITRKKKTDKRKENEIKNCTNPQKKSTESWKKKETLLFPSI